MGHYVFNQGTLPIKAWMKLNLNHNAAAATPRAQSREALQCIALLCGWDQSHKCEQMLVIFVWVYATFIARRIMQCNVLQCDICAHQENDHQLQFLQLLQLPSNFETRTLQSLWHIAQEGLLHMLALSSSEFLFCNVHCSRFGCNSVKTSVIIA